MKAKIDENAEADDDAELLRRDGEDEVRMGVGQDALHRALSGAAPEPAAVGEGFHRRIDLEGVAGILVHEPLDAVAHVRQELVGRHDAEEAGAAEPHHPEPMQAGDEEEPAPHDGHEHRLPEIGLQDQRNDRRRQDEEREERARHVVAPRSFREGPGGEDDEGGLDEFGGLYADGAEHDPPMRALDLGPELEGEEDEPHAERVDDEREPPDMAKRQERYAEQDRDGRQQEQRLAVHEMEGRETEPLRDRRAAGHEEDEPRHHERGERREERTVDGPPPIADRRSFRARHHDQAPFESSMPGRARTRSRKWFPRTS